MKSLYIFLFIFYLSHVAFAQKKKNLENIKGEWVVSKDITLAEAKENAINQAKSNALREAGVPEYVSSTNILFKTDNLNNREEFFQSITSVDISGELFKYSITREDKILNSNDEFVYQVWIDATVVLYTREKDQGFKIDVTGIREKYISSDGLMFRVKPWKEGYLTIFIMSELESFKLYPNEFERQELLIADKEYSFPRSKAIDYEVSSEGRIEINYLLFLFTKQKIAFIKLETSENILKFIAEINPSNKFLTTYSIVITK